MKKLLLLVGLAFLVGPALAATVAPLTQTYVVAWDSNTAVVNGTIPLGAAPWSSGKIVSCTYYTGGSSASFTATVYIAGTAVTGCNAMAVSSPTSTTVAATANNTFTSGQAFSVGITNVTNTPVQAIVQFNVQSTAN